MTKEELVVLQDIIFKKTNDENKKNKSHALTKFCKKKYLKKSFISKMENIMEKMILDGTIDNIITDFKNLFIEKILHSSLEKFFNKGKIFHPSLKKNFKPK